MRADARRNRERVLAAAEELFAAGGNAVQVEDVARRAGVGVGTVCRNFPTKDALLDATLEVSYRRMLDEAAAVRDEHADEPGSALEAVILRTSRHYARHRALAERARDGLELSPGTRAVQLELWDLLDELIVAAQDAGNLRTDVGGADLVLLLGGVARAAAVLSDHDPEVLERHVRLVLDGLRPGGSALPGRPMTFDDLRLPSAGGGSDRP